MLLVDQSLRPSFYQRTSDSEGVSTPGRGMETAATLGKRQEDLTQATILEFAPWTDRELTSRILRALCQLLRGPGANK